MERIKNVAIKHLRSAEKYTKTDMVYAVHGGFWLGLGQFVSSASTLIISIAFAKLLSPEVFGTYKYILSINSLLLITTLAGMDSALTQAIARGYEGTLEPAVRTKVRWGVLGSILSMLLAIYYLKQGNEIFAISFSITAFFIPFTESFDMYNSLLWGKKLFGAQTIYNIIKKCISLVALIVTIVLTRNIFIILLSYFLSITIPNIFLYYRTKKFYQKNDLVDENAINYGKNLSTVYVITLLLAELDKILIFHFLGAVKLAIYSLAVAPTDQIKGLLKNINSLAMPKFSQRDSEEIKKNIWHKIVLLGGFTSLIVISYIILAPTFFKYLFPKYLESVRFSQILSLSLVPVVIAGFIYTVLESKKDQVGIYKYNLYGNIFSLLILGPLVYYYGIWGAIASRSISRVFYLILASNLLKKVT